MAGELMTGLLAVLARNGYAGRGLLLYPVGEPPRCHYYRLRRMRTKTGLNVAHSTGPARALRIS